MRRCRLLAFSAQLKPANALRMGARPSSGQRIADSRKPTATALALLTLTVVTIAPAQQVPARLTLSDALSIARERNPEYRQALNQVNAAGAQVRAGFGRFLPNLSASMGWGLSSSRAVTGEDDYGEPKSLDVARDFKRSSASQTVSANVTLFDGFGNVNAYRASQANAAAVDAAAELTLRRIEAEAIRRFYEAMRTTRLIAVEERLLASAREQMTNTERLFRTVGARREDVLGAQTDVANQELQLARAVGDAEKARLDLKEQLGITEDVDFTVEGELPDVFDPAALDAGSLLTRAYAASPDIRRLEASADAAHLTATAARGERWPSISMGASFNRSMGLSSYNAVFEFNPQNRFFGLSLNVSFPIFRGFQTSAQIAQAEVAARNAEEAVRAGRLTVERTVRSAYIDLDNAHRALALAEQVAELSRERLQLARERYALAALQFTNLQQIINQANQAERQLVNARFDYARTVVTLEEAVGVEVRP